MHKINKCIFTFGFPIPLHFCPSFVILIFEPNRLLAPPFTLAPGAYALLASLPYFPPCLFRPCICGVRVPYFGKTWTAPLISSYIFFFTFFIRIRTEYSAIITNWAVSCVLTDTKTCIKQILSKSKSFFISFLSAIFYQVISWNACAIY